MSKKIKPIFNSPYKIMEYTLPPIIGDVPRKAIIEYINENEIDEQKKIRSQCNTDNIANARTQKRLDNSCQKLFECSSSHEIFKLILSLKNIILAPDFRYRSFTYILQQRLKENIFNDNEKYCILMAIDSMLKYGTIHPDIVSVMKLKCADTLTNDNIKNKSQVIGQIKFK